MNMDLSWMKELGDLEKLLAFDLKLVHENCGIDVVISLLENLPSINVFVSRGAVEELRDLHETKQTEELHSRLGKDMWLVYKFCGIETVISLIENLPGINFYVSQDVVTRAQKKYIRQKFNGQNVKDIAIKIRCSETFVYKVIREKMKSSRPVNQGVLFGDSE